MEAPAIEAGRPRATARRRLSAALWRRPWLRAAALLLPPLGWMVVLYLASLALLFVYAFWSLDTFTGKVIHTWTLSNFREIVDNATYRTIAFRTIGIAALVTLTDALIAFPFAYYMARLASSRTRTLLFVLVLLPLWSSYLARIYAWRLILAHDGALNWSLSNLGLPTTGVAYTNTAMWIVFSYVWLPFMVLPVYAALERIPDSYLEASQDLGAKGSRTLRSVILPIYSALERIPDSYVEASRDLGAKGWTTFRRVVLPLALPGVVAGSIFTFSLTLGDYVTPTLVGNTQFIGNVVYRNVLGLSHDLPFAAAYATIPLLVMGLYLTLAKRAGAFEAL
jgi:putative spermidine/putrescine transport system permease protein